MEFKDLRESQYSLIDQREAAMKKRKKKNLWDQSEILGGEKFNVQKIVNIVRMNIFIYRWTPS